MARSPPTRLERNCELLERGRMLGYEVHQTQRGCAVFAEERHNPMPSVVGLWPDHQRTYIKTRGTGQLRGA